VVATSGKSLLWLTSVNSQLKLKHVDRVNHFFSATYCVLPNKLILVLRLLCRNAEENPTTWLFTHISFLVPTLRSAWLA